MDKYIKRIQSRLTSLKVTFQGRTIPMWMVRQYYEVLVSDRYNPTEEDLTNVIEAIKAKVQEPAPTIEAEAIAPVTSQAQEPETEITIPAPQTYDIPVEDLPCLQPSEEKPEPETGAIAPTAPLTITDTTQSITTGGITQAEVTQAISQAVAQVGADSSAETIELLTSLANELSKDISSVQEMASALITAYLGKRQTLLASAIGTINTLRSAQTSSFQAGLDQDFFDQKERDKRQFLKSLQEIFG
jgi:hypothetical protein